MFSDFEAAKDEIIDVCYSLVDPEPQSVTFQFAHLSLTHLLDHKERTSGQHELHTEVANRCLS